MTDIKEFPVDSRDFFSKTMYLAKEFLNNEKKIKIVASTVSASYAARLAETLKRFGYVEFDDIQTETLIREGRRQTRMVITVHVTSEFDKLYKESLEERKKREEERKKEGGKKPWRIEEMKKRK